MISSREEVSSIGRMELCKHKFNPLWDSIKLVYRICDISVCISKLLVCNLFGTVCNWSNIQASLQQGAWAQLIPLLSASMFGCLSIHRLLNWYRQHTNELPMMTFLCSPLKYCNANNWLNEYIEWILMSQAAARYQACSMPLDQVMFLTGSRIASTSCRSSLSIPEVDNSIAAATFSSTYNQGTEVIICSVTWTEKNQ